MLSPPGSPPSGKRTGKPAGRLPSARCARRFASLVLLVATSNLAVLYWAGSFASSQPPPLPPPEYRLAAGPMTAPPIHPTGDAAPIHGSTAHVAAASAGLAHEHMYGRIPKMIHQTWKSKNLPDW